MAPFALKSLLFLLPFLGCCGAQEILPEGPVDALLGGTVTLKTLFNNQQYTVIIWNFNNGVREINIATVTAASVRVNTPYQGRVSVNSTNGFLTLASLTAADSGSYSISVVLPDGSTLPGEIKLRVVEPVSEVVIKSNLPEAIEYSSTVALTCTAKGSALSFKWTNGTTAIVDDGKRITLTRGDSSSTLTIGNVLRSDLTGPIYCTASNALTNKTSAPFNLTVYYGPDNVAITPANPPKFVESGSTFSLTCSAVSLPPASFKWFSNGSLMEATGPNLTLNVIEAHKITATTGFTCSAENAKTKRNATSAGVSFGVMKGITSAELKGPTGLLITGNSSANFSCQVTGGTVETVEWLKDGKPLSEDPRMVFSTDRRSVFITVLQKGDNGNFTCRARNAINSKDGVYTMVVNYGPEQPTVTGAKATEVNRQETLTCSAPSVPAARYTWKLNGTDTKVTTPVYSIQSASYKDSGTYTCEAYNIITGKTTTASHILSVKEEGSLDGLSDGAIAGIVIGVLAAVGVAIGLFFYCRQKVPVDSPY
ncbi:carcinoembryonic antigen-related cell adhesion molecule 1-like [Archocentrus centrarchus]|uniref:carcinoembryonic antigen-related cell adhesion molecule 1-like n=1 Tax=Archocentrus centrarchus TaxID=63155 RepID=UPI0011E9C2FD|nr:carcinoembryonic antigen-related cell adhesion molecule 1-like [Archocentrus centrarchus]